MGAEENQLPTALEVGALTAELSYHPDIQCFPEPSGLYSLSIEYILSLHSCLINFAAHYLQFLILQDRMKRKLSVEEGDHISLVNVYNAFIEVSRNCCYVNRL